MQYPVKSMLHTHIRVCSIHNNISSLFENVYNYTQTTEKNKTFLELRR